MTEVSPATICNSISSGWVDGVATFPIESSFLPHSFGGIPSFFFFFHTRCTHFDIAYVPHNSKTLYGWVCRNKYSSSFWLRQKKVTQTAS